MSEESEVKNNHDEAQKRGIVSFIHLFSFKVVKELVVMNKHTRLISVKLLKERKRTHPVI